MLGLRYLLTHIISSLYCTFFIEAGGYAVASKLNLCLIEYAQVCASPVSDWILNARVGAKQREFLTLHWSDSGHISAMKT